MKLLKLVVCLQKLCRIFSVCLFEGDIYPLDPISNGRTCTLSSVTSFRKCEYFSNFLILAFEMFGSNGTVSSKIYISLSLSITMSGFKGVTQRWGGMVTPPGREKLGISAYRSHFSGLIDLQMYVSMLSWRQV